MSREIKFRYVFKRKADGHIYMLEFKIELLEDGSPNPVESMIQNHLWELVSRDQYTGLKDKNGNEIYEWDIIQYQNECADRTPVLVPEMTPKNLEYITGIGNSEWEEKENQYSNIEVIGNIYENPELVPNDN